MCNIDPNNFFNLLIKLNPCDLMSSICHVLYNCLFQEML